MVRFTPWPQVGTAYGAPMGRFGGQLDLEEAHTDDLAVAGPAGEYDAGGAYWGYSPSEGGVYAVWVKGKGREGVVYVRAHSREGAKRQVLVDVVCEVVRLVSWSDPTFEGFALIDHDGTERWVGDWSRKRAEEFSTEHGLDYIG